MSVPAPTNAYAAHIGNGIVQIHILHPDYSLVNYFDVVTSDALTGNYYSIGNNRITGEDGFMYGFLPGKTIYMKVRAVGADNTVSSFIQVTLGVISKQTVVMQCTGVKGSIIAAGSIFSCARNHRVFGVRATQQINFQ